MGKKINFAAIDIGSNAVRLLIKGVEKDADNEPKFIKELFLRVPLRLGFDVFDCGKVSEEKKEKFVRLMKAYRNLMRIYNVRAYRACATSAMRDALNGKEIIQTVAKEARLDIEIIAGEEEARIIYNNHVEHLEDTAGNCLYVDVGGGSTEINFMSQGKLIASRSYNIGTVRMLEGKVSEAAITRMNYELTELTAGYTNVHIIGSGGNINKYGKLLGTKGAHGGYVISIPDLKNIYEALAALDPEARMTQYNLKGDRADVIVPAGLIFLTVAEAILAVDIQVPVIGLSDGIIDTLYKDYYK